MHKFVFLTFGLVLAFLSTSEASASPKRSFLMPYPIFKDDSGQELLLLGTKEARDLARMNKQRDEKIKAALRDLKLKAKAKVAERRRRKSIWAQRQALKASLSKAQDRNGEKKQEFGWGSFVGKSWVPENQRHQRY